jgi:hypothetical protein
MSTRRQAAAAEPETVPEGQIDPEGVPDEAAAAEVPAAGSQIGPPTTDAEAAQRLADALGAIDALSPDVKQQVLARLGVPEDRALQTAKEAAAAARVVEPFEITAGKQPLDSEATKEMSLADVVGKVKAAGIKTKDTATSDERDVTDDDVLGYAVRARQAADGSPVASSAALVVVLANGGTKVAIPLNGKK